MLFVFYVKMNKILFVDFNIVVEKGSKKIEKVISGGLSKYRVIRPGFGAFGTFATVQRLQNVTLFSGSTWFYTRVLKKGPFWVLFTFFGSFSEIFVHVAF